MLDESQGLLRGGKCRLIRIRFQRSDIEMVLGKNVKTAVDLQVPHGS